jgi:hypothetical protein
VDVGDDHCRAMSETLAKKILGVASLSDNFESRLSEKSRNALAQQDIVFADHHA